MNPIGILGTILALLLLAVISAVLIVMLLVPLCRFIGRVIRRIFRFVGGIIGDTFRLLGGIVTAGVFVPLVLVSIVLGRWSAASHYGRAVQGECRAIGASTYRLFVGHPVRLLGLEALTDGIERRVPEAIAAAPGRDTPRSRANRFDGYRIIGSLTGGGSGGRLYVAEPDDRKIEAFRKRGLGEIDRVVIKAFSLDDGSTMPQIVRESRALDAAKRLGLVFEHSLTDERFYYVMRYVPGEPLGLVTQRLHAESAHDGLDDAHLRTVLGYGANLLSTLRTYHEGGLWHKDVKPDNIIVDGARAQLVDLGLVTPLRSAMTLTTHGTEYFRDPEMVRMALRGVKVHQVDGAKFDVYAAGAVLYSMVENSFPAHGGLSQITRRCPEALRWIVRRAMTDYNRRYAHVAEMEADLAVVIAAPDPFTLRPADLPSVSGQTPEPSPSPSPSPGGAGFQPASGSTPPLGGAGLPGGAHRVQPPPAPSPDPASPTTPPRRRPSLAITNWWTGRYSVLEDEGEPFHVADAGDDRGLGLSEVRRAGTPRQHAHATRRERRAAAHEQLASARARAETARRRARERRRAAGRRGPPTADAPASFNAGVAVSVLIFLAAASTLTATVLLTGRERSTDSAPAGEAAASSGTAAHQNASLDANGAYDTDGVRLLDEIDTDNAGFPESTLMLEDRSGLVGIGPAGLIARSAAVAGGGRFELLVDGTALLLNDLRAPLSDNVLDAVGEVTGRLRGVGFRLTEGGDDEAEASQWAAELHSIRRMRPLDSADVQTEVADWINTNPRIDAVVWVEPGQNDTPGFRLFLAEPETGDMSVKARRLMRNFAASIAVHGPDTHRHTGTP